jgi:hypothetical protein
VEKSMTDESRRELEDIKFLIESNRDLIKPMFGTMFWQLLEAEKTMSPSDLAREGINLSLISDDDEVLATFMTAYIRLWESAGDLNAASRFIATTLEMTADELIQTRQLLNKL